MPRLHYIAQIWTQNRTPIALSHRFKLGNGSPVVRIMGKIPVTVRLRLLFCYVQNIFCAVIFHGGPHLTTGLHCSMSVAFQATSLYFATSPKWRNMCNQAGTTGNVLQRFLATMIQERKPGPHALICMTNSPPWSSRWWGTKHTVNVRYKIQYSIYILHEAHCKHLGKP